MRLKWADASADAHAPFLIICYTAKYPVVSNKRKWFTLGYYGNLVTLSKSFTFLCILKKHKAQWKNIR